MSWIFRLSYDCYDAGRQRVNVFNTWEPWQKIRRGTQGPIYRISDTGWLGLTPLETHILICGFHASGTTLLQLMIENGLPKARRFGRERSGWKAATYSLRNHAILISKLPHDVLRLDPLRAFYADRKAQLRVILMLRDPRDLLTTQRKEGDLLVYRGSTEHFRQYYTAFIREKDRPGALVVRYEDLICNTAAEQHRIETFVEKNMAVAFENFLTVKREDFDTTTLNGLRPIDPSRIARWKKPVHHERIRESLQLLPELPAMLERLGYENDSAWADEYR